MAVWRYAAVERCEYRMMWTVRREFFRGSEEERPGGVLRQNGCVSTAERDV